METMAWRKKTDETELSESVLSKSADSGTFHTKLRQTCFDLRFYVLYKW